MATAEILFVCTGNVCRSPLAERLLRSGLDALWAPAAEDVLVHSAGTQALVGQPMTAETVAQLGLCGASAVGFTSRQLAAEMTRSATLVLALTRAHRGPVVEDHPAAARVTFTLREIARLLADVPTDSIRGVTAAQRVQAVTDLAGRRRGLVPFVAPADDDVTDPYGGGITRYRTTTAEIVPAVQGLLRLLAPR